MLVERSGFFAAICNGHFKESHDKSVELHDDPIAVASMIKWIKQDYDDNPYGYDVVCGDDCVCLLELLESGYQKEHANEVAVKLLEAFRVGDTYNSFQMKLMLNSFELADKYDMRKFSNDLLDLILDIVGSWKDSVWKVVYFAFVAEIDTCEMKKRLVGHFVKHIKHYRGGARFEELITTHHAFALDILRSLANRADGEDVELIF